MKPDLSLVDPLDYNLATRANVGDGLVRTAALYPDRVAVVDQGREVTYRELAATADRFGHALLGLGLAPGTPVALFMMNSWQMLATYYACARAGLVCMPVNFLLSPADLAWILSDSGTPVVIYDPPLRPLAEAVAAQVPGVTNVIVREEDPAPVADRTTHGWDALVDGATTNPLQVLIDDRDTVQCLYTSGTTARPKGTLTSHVSVTIATLSNAIAVRESWGAIPSVMLTVLPLFHVTALNTLVMPILGMGGTVVLPGPAFHPEVALDSIEKYGVTHMMMLPMMHAACAEAQAAVPRDLSSVTTAIYAMAPMPTELLERVDAMYPNAAVVLGSGQTEVLPATAMQWPEHQQSAPDSWGTQTPSVLIGIVDPTGRELPVGEVGEIAYRSPNVCSGYWNNPQANEASFANGWFQSGDIGHLDEEAVLWFSDRLKDIIKSGGENVSSIAVERVVLSCPGVAEASVIGIPDDRWIELVCAVVVPDGSVPEAELEGRIIAHAKQHLARFQVPKTVRVFEQLPKTATGKIRKNEVRAQLE